ncbi:expressed protein [Phakopsora pachyrhizi]|uniref:DASH complex subunit SPC19 n=1 Tax=Phakopsora pachyrhizi TaxID=170000 RepID=A0AAV0BXF2_PHAPC|nr:expressed protein [Phakopsora pachyrhizi]
MSDNQQRTTTIQDQLNRSIQNLVSINSNLNQANRSLEENLNQIPRLETVLRNQQFFEIVSISEIRSNEYQLISEIEPKIKDILRLIESGLVKLQRRETSLRSSMLKNQRSPFSTDRWDDDVSSEERDEDAERLNQIRKNKAELLKQLKSLDSKIDLQKKIFNKQSTPDLL